MSLKHLVLHVLAKCVLMYTLYPYLLIAYLSCVTIKLVFDSKWPLLYMVIMDERREGRGGEGMEGKGD